VSELEFERQLDLSHRRLAHLRERAERAGHGPESPLYEAVEALGHTLEELSVTLQELASTSEELSESQLEAERHARRYLDLFRTAPDAYVVTDERGTIRELNDVAEHQLGRPLRYLAGKPLLPLVAASDRDRFLECLSLLQQRRGRLVDRDIRFGSDSPFDALVSAVPEQRDGEVEIRWILRDVSELKERDSFRDEMERHLRGVVFLQQRNPPKLLHVSAAYETIFGRPVEWILRDPRDWLEAVEPEDRPRVEAAFEAVLDGQPFDEEYRIRRPDGELRWIYSRATPFEGPGGRFDRAAGFAEDVTERKATEAALRKAERRRRAAVQAAERAEARERRALAGDLHDAISQTLALAKTKLAALGDELGESEPGECVREVRSLVREAAERTRTLTFRLSPPILHDLGLAAAAEWLAEDMGRQFGLHVSVSDDGLHESLPFEVREGLFRSLRELLINVARHAGTEKAHVTLAREGDALTITVEDGGIGFEFGRGGSVGFGLVSMRDRMQALGGRLEIDSKVGAGTRARLVLPTREDD
jgi:PAS domain S-box-containing protein